MKLALVVDASQRVTATTKRSEKVAMLADLLRDSTPTTSQVFVPPLGC